MPIDLRIGQRPIHVEDDRLELSHLSYAFIASIAFICVAFMDAEDTPPWHPRQL